ncbi:MAG: recombinase family protein [Bacteroidales bacterium]|nr:recombinase family protein [Bacteroidales bacterium]
MKKCGLVIRVSTYRQARNQEGSLKNQLQRLQAHISYKNTTGDEQWAEKGRYILKAVSGKDAFRNQVFARLISDIKSGKIDTVLCTALDRISRSVKDFLNFFEILHEYDVEFVCIKQNYDTTTPQGKLFITIMMALAEFEREQTSDRNKEASLARAERGLWNGSQVFGYDLNPDKKGYLFPNEKEKVIVNYAFDTYLKCGSLLDTARKMNQLGYRTKEYTSKRSIYHPAELFTYSTVQYILTNYAYIGKKEINKKMKNLDQDTLQNAKKYRIVDGVWEGIVDEERFNQVRELININQKAKHNKVKPVKHNYILNSGLLFCEKCGSEMEGRSGTGKQGNRYYYYRCKNNECGFKVPANEIERVIIDRLKVLSKNEGILPFIVKSANQALRKELPQLIGQRKLLVKELDEIKSFASKVLGEWASLSTSDDTVFVKEELEKLSKRRKQIEEGIQALEDTIAEIEKETISQELIKLALNKFTDLFDSLPPYRQKELLKLTVNKIIVSDKQIKIALYGQPPDKELLEIYETGKRSQTLDWLLG